MANSLELKHNLPPSPVSRNTHFFAELDALATHSFSPFLFVSPHRSSPSFPTALTTMAFATPPTARTFRPARVPLPSCQRPHSYRLPRRSRVQAQLIGMPEGFGQSVTPDENEIILAELRFSEPDKLPALIQNNLPKLDDSFYAFLEEKINKSPDIPERDNLRALRDAITDVMKALYEQAQHADDNASAPAEESAAPAINVSSGGQEVATASYDELLEQFSEALSQGPAALRTSIDASYDRIDVRLLERLGERISAGGEHAKSAQDVRDAISNAMNERMAAAMEAVKSVLAAGNPNAVRTAVDTLARKGKIDDAFILLLQANIQQAEQAGATEAVKVVKMVLDHASSVNEVGLEPEIKLIRSLLRTEDKAARIEILKEGLTPRGTVTNIDGSTTQGMKVDGKKFVIALRKLIEEFGNVDEKFILKLSAIGEESEAVARKLFDMEDKDVKDLQDEAFHKRSVSIWDLERIEMEEQMQGREAAWEGRLGPIPEGFDEQGKMQV